MKYINDKLEKLYVSKERNIDDIDNAQKEIKFYESRLYDYLEEQKVLDKEIEFYDSLD